MWSRNLFVAAFLAPVMGRAQYAESWFPSPCGVTYGTDSLVCALPGGGGGIATAQAMLPTQMFPASIAASTLTALPQSSPYHLAMFGGAEIIDGLTYAGHTPSSVIFQMAITQTLTPGYDSGNVNYESGNNAYAAAGLVLLQTGGTPLSGGLTDGQRFGALTTTKTGYTMTLPLLNNPADDTIAFSAIVGALAWAGPGGTEFSSTTLAITDVAFLDANGAPIAKESYALTPEPSSLALLGTALLGLVPMVRRKGLWREREPWRSLGQA